ncbi:fungal-specific transcription factor domain-containing protein, partial [Xylariaceae sp. FL0016]
MSLRGKAETRRRKRTKTFTGCWTCRSRKVKCDEAKPSCRVCIDKNLVCQGYGTRLQWLPPETGFDVLGEGLASSEQAGPAAEAEQQRCLRRYIFNEPPRRILAWRRVDEILQTIDAAEYDLGPRDGVELALHIENFGVFGKNYLKWPSPSVSCAIATPRADAPALASPQHGSSIDTPQPGLYAVGMGFPLTSQTRSTGSWDHGDHRRSYNVLNQRSSPARQPDETTYSRRLDPPQRSSALGSRDRGDLLILADAARLLQPPLDSPQDSRTSSGTPAAPPSPYFLGEQERYLLHHYMNRVVNLFCVIDNDNSPWKTIHLPIVLQSIGELSIVGSTSRVRSALRNALVAISAFYLSNEHQAHNRPVESEKWENIASGHRCEAIGLLKEAVEHDLYTAVRPKYNDFLVTMLSMVTVNVVSGDTNSCSVHLDGAEQLINHISQTVKLSNESQVLHRIYFYLRVIYESTSSKVMDTTSPRFGSMFASKEQAAPELLEGDAHDFLGTNNADSTLLESRTDSPPFEYIYGVPSILLVMLKDTIDFIDANNRAQSQNGRKTASDDLEGIYDKLESEILDWSMDEHLEKFRDLDDDQFNIMYQQTKAFHNALIIYFSQNVGRLGFRHLRPYVEAVLDSIEAIEHIKSKTNGLAAPLYWPAFVAATEAFEPRHQQRFREWYDKVEQYGIEGARTGIRVIHEVWQRSRSRNRGQKTAWRCIAEETGATLML